MNLSPSKSFARRWMAAALALCAAAVPGRAFSADPFEDVVRKTEPLTPAEEQKAFHLPAGFEMQLVACEPEIGKPINMAFDSAGRLWVTQSREYPFPAPLDQPGRDRIRVLSDFDKRTGKARKVETFVEGLNIPIGLYPYKRGAIGFSIPSIYFFGDTNRDGKADTKDLLLTRFGFEKDTHGLTGSFRRGFDGWIYADHGFNNDSSVSARDGSTVKMNSGNCYRFRPDGSHIEQYSWGQVNPFGLMFDPLGDLWSADCHSSPVYQLLRGAYYPSFGKPHDGLGFAPNICPHSHGSTAIAGMVFYAAEHFPAEYRASTFVGNVMTCRINRDTLEEHGSTRLCKEAPDFMHSDDPWFRPVDLQLGPDGAIYVADFYNRIIGHYEVPLTHPGRDRERGRIWRIVYRGPNNSAVPEISPAFEAASASVNTLLRELGDSNITRRMLAMNELVDRVGAPAIKPVRKMVAARKSNEFQIAHGLWVLHRLGGISASELAKDARNSSFLVRVHVMHILAETSSPSDGLLELARQGLVDSNAYVRRAAADALGQHSHPQNVQPLLAAWSAVPPDDSQLLHTVRMALRNQFLNNEVFDTVDGLQLSTGELARVAEVSVAVKSEAAARWLLQHLDHLEVGHARLMEILRHAVRYGNASQVLQVAGFVQTHFAEDPDFQLDLFRAVEEGTKQRGSDLAPSLKAWGTDLANLLVSSKVNSGWINQVVPGLETPDPWFTQLRSSSDGRRDLPFLSSLPPGGESLTGILRSPTFSAPPKFSFFLAGHDGVPSGPLLHKNKVRLCRAGSGETLMEVSPPRNDSAKRITWDLAKYEGQKVYLEVMDTATEEGFAWLAIGRFNPKVISVPEFGPRQVEARHAAVAQLATEFHIASLIPVLRQWFADRSADIESRAAAARALSELDSTGLEEPAAQVLGDASEPLRMRAALAATLGEANSPAARKLLIAAFASAPATLQRAIASALAASAPGAEALLQAIADGKASPRLLQDRPLMDKLKADKLDARAGQLVANLPPANETRDKLIAERRNGFIREKASAQAGGEIFQKNCAICHRLENQGAVIGPQLDGVGGRGADRLLEDILDPSRNVDRAFRTTVFVMRDGDVQSGLLRREEGATLVIADATGKEITLDKKEIKERRESETSLMPDNFGELLNQEELNDLTAFLLSKNSKVLAGAAH